MGKGIAGQTGFDPADWSVVGYYYIGDSDEAHKVYKDEMTELAEILGDDADIYMTVSQCQSCGTHYNHGAVIKNKDGGLISVGGICATEYFGLPNITALKIGQAAKLKQAAAWAAEAAAKKAKTLEDNPGLAEALETDHYIVNDIGEKLTKWGNLSPAQIALVFKIAKEVADAKAAGPKVEKPKVPVVTGAGLVLTGTVLGTKWQESYYGYGDTLKMLVEVEADGGVYKVFGTVPKALGGDPKGEKVTFIANVEVSKDDESFGFFSAQAGQLPGRRPPGDLRLPRVDSNNTLMYYLG